MLSPRARTTYTAASVTALSVWKPKARSRKGYRRRAAMMAMRLSRICCSTREPIPGDGQRGLLKAAFPQDPRRLEHQDQHQNQKHRSASPGRRQILVAEGGEE